MIKINQEINLPFNGKGRIIKIFIHPWASLVKYKVLEDSIFYKKMI